MNVRPVMAWICLGAIANAGAATAQTIAPPAPAAAGTAAFDRDMRSGLWWTDGALHDQQGTATLTEVFRFAPGQIVVAAPGNGTGLLTVQHGRAASGVSINGILLPGVVPFDLALPDIDLALATPPSGLDHGAAGAAGLLAISVRRPAERLAGAGEFAAGAFGSRRALARLDVPVTNGVRLGLGGVLHHDLGWLRNVRTGERLNRGQRRGLDAALDIDLASDLRLAIDGLYQRNESGNLPAFACDPLDPARCGGRFASTGQRGNDGLAPAISRWGAISADLAQQPFGQSADLLLSAAELAWAPANVTLRLKAGLTRQDDRLGLDLRDGRRAMAIAQPVGLASGGYGLVAHGTSEGRQIDVAAGIEIGALTLNLGAGLRGENSSRNQADIDAGVVIADRSIGQRRDSGHVAGAARMMLFGTSLTLDAGFRWTNERLSLDVRDRLPSCGPCLLPSGQDRQRQRFLTPELAVEWRQGDVLFFARSTRTARLPGWNLLARRSAELVALPAETGWHHEAGIDVDSADGKLHLRANGFLARTQGLVTPLFGIDPIAMAVAAAQRSDLRAIGIDAAMRAQPFDQLDLSATLTMQRARWSGSAAPALAPARPLYAPDLTASLSATWTYALVGAGANLVPRLTIDYRSAMAVAAGPVPGAQGGVAPAGWQVAGAVQLVIPDGGWLVSLECRNCLDRVMIDGAVAGLATLNPPRWWQVRFLRRF